MIPIPESVHGTRVVLRRPAEADIPELIALNAASRSHHHPWTSGPTTPEAGAVFVERARREATACYLVRHGATDAILGVVTLSQIVYANFRSAYLGYNIGAPWARQGYMTESLQVILDLAFGPLELHRVEANIQPGNVASIELVKKLGFRLEGFSPRYLNINGVWCDHERWAVLTEEWAAQARPTGGRGANSDGASHERSSRRGLHVYSTCQTHSSRPTHPGGGRCQTPASVRLRPDGGV